MTIVHHAAAYSDVGLEWGRMWLLQLVSPDMQYENLHQAAEVKRVIVARRRASGSRDRGYSHHIFVRRLGHTYGEFEYDEVLDDTAFAANSGPNIFGQVGRLFLTELEAWQAYATWATVVHRPPSSETRDSRAHAQRNRGDHAFESRQDPMSEQLHEAWAGVAARQAALIAELQAEIEAAEAAHAGDGQPHKLTDALIAILRKHGYEPKR